MPDLRCCPKCKEPSENLFQTAFYRQPRFQAAPASNARFPARKIVL